MLSTATNISTATWENYFKQSGTVLGLHVIWLMVNTNFIVKDSVLRLAKAICTAAVHLMFIWLFARRTVEGAIAAV